MTETRRATHPVTQPGVRRVPRFVPMLNRVAKPLLSAGVPMGYNGLLTVRGRNEDKVRFSADHLRKELDTALKDFPDLILKLLAAGHKVMAYPNEALWLDLGRHEDLMEASSLFAARQDEFLPRQPPAP